MQAAGRMELSDSPAPKRSRLSGAATYNTRFNPSWCDQFPFITQGKQDPLYSFHCKVCNKDYRCSHQGIADIKRHESSKTHQCIVKSAASTSSLSNMGFVPVGSDIDQQAKRAEVKLAVLLAQYNIPLAIMDHLSPMMRDIFPDSKIAKAFSSARTKTSYIVNLALRPHFEQALVTHMKTQPFALATDGSNDNGIQKMNPLTVRVFDLDSGCVGTRFLDMYLSPSGTAEGIFNVLNAALESRGIVLVWG